MKKSTKIILISLVLIIIVIIVSILISNLSNLEPLIPKQSEIANPAAVYCVEQGNEYEIKTNEDGSQSGTCVFSDGTDCDGWEYYKGECLK